MTKANNSQANTHHCSRNPRKAKRRRYANDHYDDRSSSEGVVEDRSHTPPLVVAVPVVAAGDRSAVEMASSDNTPRLRPFRTVGDLASAPF